MEKQISKQPSILWTLIIDIMLYVKHLHLTEQTRWLRELENLVGTYSERCEWKFALTTVNDKNIC